MRTYLYLFASLILFSPVCFAQDKYGLLACSDEALLAKVQDSEYVAVILGCVYKLDAPLDPAKSVHISHVTVIDSYKGPLIMGQNIVISIESEGGPKQEQELGRLRFFFLQSNHNSYAPKDAYSCEPVDTIPYSVNYGERALKLLRGGSMIKPFNMLLPIVEGPGTTMVPNNLDQMNLVTGGIYAAYNREAIYNNGFYKWYPFTRVGLYSFNCKKTLHRFDYLYSTEAAWIDVFQNENAIVFDE